MRYVILLCVFLTGACCYPGKLAAWQFSIRGRVVDSEQAPLPGVQLSLYHMPDSLLYRSTGSGADGDFRFDPQGAGEWQIRAEAMGYRTYWSEAIRPGDTQSLIVRMTAVSAALQDVTITAERPVIERHPDRMVLHVDQMLTVAGGSAWEVLEQAPGVQTGNDRLTLKGKEHVVVWVDNQRVSLDEAGLSDYLKALPAGLLDRVELISQPPAQYDASGNGGVIRIYLKKGKKRGLNGTLQSENIKGRCARIMQNLSVNLRSSKLNLYGNVSNYNGSGIADVASERQYNSNGPQGLQQWEQQSVIRTRLDRILTTAGADWSPGEKDNLGLSVTYMHRKGRQQAIGQGMQDYADRVMDTFFQTRNRNDDVTVNAGAGLSYVHKFDTAGRQLRIGADYTGYRQQQYLYNDTWSGPAGNEGAAAESLNGKQDIDVRVYSLAADAVVPFRTKYKLEAGIKGAWCRSRYAAAYSMDPPGGLAGYSNNRFGYDEDVYAAYANYHAAWHRLSLQLGLRLEHTIAESGTEKEGLPAMRRYTDVFPTLFLEYGLDAQSRHQLQLSYGRRIDRPGYQELNPFPLPRDRYTFLTGNAWLQPSRSDNAELTYQWKQMLSVGLSYSYITDNMGTVIVPEADRFYLQAANTGSLHQLGLSAEGSLNPAAWWQVRPSFQYRYLLSRNNADLSGGRWAGGYCTARLTQQFTFGHAWTAEMFTEYASRQPFPQYSNAPVWYMHAGIGKKLWQDRLSIKLNLRDLWHTRVDRQDYQRLQGINGYTSRTWDTRSITLLLSYRFSYGRKAGSAPVHIPGPEAQKRLGIE